MKFNKSVMNASGVFSDHPYLLKIWEQAGCDVVVTKSITLNERKANEFSYDDKKIILIKGENWTVNSMGLPNHGLVWWRRELQKYRFNVPVIASIAINYEIVEELEDVVDAFEINVSCPNTEKEIIGYNCKSFEETLNAYNTKKPIIVKLPCYFDDLHFKELALNYIDAGKCWDIETFIYKAPTELDKEKLLEVLDLLDDLDIKYVTSHNTVPVKIPLLPTPQGGMSGFPIHEIAVKQARFISENSNLKIIGCGGIYTNKDAEDYWSIKNVVGVQLASGFFRYENAAKFVNEVKTSSW